MSQMVILAALFGLLLGLWNLLCIWMQTLQITQRNLASSKIIQRSSPWNPSPSATYPMNCTNGRENTPLTTGYPSTSFTRSHWKNSLTVKPNNKRWRNAPWWLIMQPTWYKTKYPSNRKYDSNDEYPRVSFHSRPLSYQPIVRPYLDSENNFFLSTIKALFAEQLFPSP